MRLSLTLMVLVPLSLAASACTGGDEKSNDSTQSPLVESVSPGSAVVGDTITILGESFGEFGPEETNLVRIGGADATIVSWNPEEINATVPPGAYPGSRDVVVENGVGVSNAVALAVVLPRALYVNDDINNNNVIEGFAISFDGTPAGLPASPWQQGVDGPGYGGYGGTLALDIARRRVLTTANSRLYAWDVDPATGALTTSGSLTLTGTTLAYGAEIDASGAYGYVADYMNGAVQGAVIASDGTLSAIAGSPFDAGATGTSRLAFSMDGAFLYANNEETFEISGYVVGANGVLAELPNSPYLGLGASFAFDRAPNADRFYLSLGSYIAVYEPDAAGDLTENVALRETSPGPAYLAFAGDGSRLFAAAQNQLFVFDVAPSGELVAVADSPFSLTGVANPTAVRASGDGSLILVKDVNAAEFGVFSINAAGVPEDIGGSPFPLQPTAFGSGAAFSF